MELCVSNQISCKACKYSWRQDNISHLHSLHLPCEVLLPKEDGGEGDGSSSQPHEAASGNTFNMSFSAEWGHFNAFICHFCFLILVRNYFLCDIFHSSEKTGIKHGSIISFTFYFRELRKITNSKILLALRLYIVVKTKIAIVPRRGFRY